MTSVCVDDGDVLSVAIMSVMASPKPRQNHREENKESCTEAELQTALAYFFVVR
jgi:hypothetical protein